MLGPRSTAHRNARHLALALFVALGCASLARGDVLPLRLEVFGPESGEESQRFALWAPSADGAASALLARLAGDNGGLEAALQANATAAPHSQAMPQLAALPRRVWDDLGALVVRPLHFDRQDWTRLGVGVAAIAATSAFDSRVRTFVQNHSGQGSRDLADRVRAFGSRPGPVVMLVLLGVGELTGNANLAATGADGLEATLFAVGLVSPAIQAVAGRARPDANQGPHSFHPFSGGASFPSGEVTTAFTLAAVVTAHSESVVLRSIVWSLAGVVGWERLEVDRHWASDVVAGALVGCAVGRWVVHRQERRSGARVAWGWQPLVAPGKLGVRVAASW